MKNQALCQYKHGSVWSKDYDSAGGKKRLCIFLPLLRHFNPAKPVVEKSVIL